jgi:HTH-type transcriptional regulator/antitoxin HigA
MTNELKPIQTEADYDTALAEVERLWGAGVGSPEGDQLDALATLIDAYEAQHYPMGCPKPSSLNGDAKSGAKEPSP